MGKGSNTTTTNSTSTPDPQAASLYRDILTRAQGVASTPYQAYTGDLTAPINSQQQAGIAGINSNANYASPYITQAAGLAQASSAPITQSQISQYLNPYTQDVVNATTQQLQHDNGVAMANLQGNQIAQGALGGNATGVAKGILAGQQNRTNASTVAGLYSQGYTQALGAAQQQQQAGLAGANALANYGIQGQNAALSGANAQLGAGSLEQTNEQARLNALYQQYQLAQAYPYQQTQWLAGVGTGVGSNLGGTSVGTSTGPAPNQTAQYLGAGLTAASMFLSDRRAKEDIHKIGETNDGQNIYRYRYKGQPGYHIGLIAQEVEQDHPEAVTQGLGGVRYVDMKGATDDAIERASGGGVSATPFGEVQGWIPTMQIHGGSGAPHASAPSPSSNQQQSATDFTKLANGITSFGKGVQGLDWSGLNATGLGGASGDAWGGGSFIGGDAYGGSGAAPLAGLDPLDYGEGFADGGAVMSDEDPVGVAAGQQYAQSSPWQLRPTQNGQVQVINIRTGQVVHTGTHATASSMASSMNARQRAAGGGVAGYATGGSPDLQDWLSDGGFNALDAEALHREAAAARGPVPGADLNFEDRAAPTIGALARGDFDTQGANNTTFEGTPGMQASNAGLVPTPRSRPEAAGAPVVADDDEGDDTPATGVAPAGRSPQAPVMAFQPEGAAGSYRGIPDAITAPRSSGFGLGLISPNAQTGLMAAGLGMLASRSPFLGNAVGEGGIAGLSAYGAANEADRKAAEEAQKLSREAQKLNFEQNLNLRKQGETERHNRTTEETARTNADRTKWTPAGQYMGEDGIYRPVVMNTSTGEMKDPVTGKAVGPEAKIVGKNDSGFTDDDARNLAKRYIASGDRTVLMGLGPAGKIKTQRAIDAELKSQGITNEDMAQRTVEFEGRKAGSRTLGTMEAKMGSAAMEAEGAIKLVRGVIERLPRTSFLPFNRMVEGYSKGTLNPDQAELYARAQAIVNTYSAVMSRGANVTTDSSRHHAADLLNTAYDAKTFNRVLDTMLQEIDMAKGSPARMQQYYREHYGPKSVEGGEGSAGTPPLSRGFNPAQHPEAIPRSYNGKTYYYDPVTKQPYPGQ